jgi:hypothetical protein
MLNKQAGPQKAMLKQQAVTQQSMLKQQAATAAEREKCQAQAQAIIEAKQKEEIDWYRSKLDAAKRQITKFQSESRLGQQFLMLVEKTHSCRKPIYLPVPAYPPETAIPPFQEAPVVPQV